MEILSSILRKLLNPIHFSESASLCKVQSAKIQILDLHIKSIGTSCSFPWKQSIETDNYHYDNNYMYGYLLFISIITILKLML
jgi:hypothetical protein